MEQDKNPQQAAASRMWQGLPNGVSEGKDPVQRLECSVTGVQGGIWGGFSWQSLQSDRGRPKPVAHPCA